MTRTLAAALAAIALLAPAAPAQQEASTTPAVGPLDALDGVAAAIVERVAPSVVLIEVERPARAPRRLTAREVAGLGLGPNYDPRYFTRPDAPVTGVVIGPGLVATSQWNLEGDGALTVITPDGARLPAKRLGRDENLDVALVGVEGAGLPAPLPLAPENPAVGRFLLLVGRTPQNGPMVTLGMVSGLGRHRGDAFAHSARTNYQNAGGALVDIEGRLVGVSVRHTDRSRQGQSSGVGFGAPALAVQVQVPGLAKGDVVPRRKTPFLGIQGTQEVIEGGGCLVGGVLDGTAAKAAGLRAGDVIKIFNNVELRDFLHLREEIEKLSVGSEIVITVKRGDEELDFKVKLGARAEEE
ncbi:MAG: S1C family serine protease [Planctomycetes bacterium]|nr:S1C family serine protease [Planctomycetota bacterium]